MLQPTVALLHGEDPALRVLLEEDPETDVLLLLVLCTVYCVLCTVYCVLCTVYCVLCTEYCVLCTEYCVLCTVYCVTINVVSETRRMPVFYTSGLFQTAHCEMAESMMGEEEACLDTKQKRTRG